MECSICRRKNVNREQNSRKAAAKERERIRKRNTESGQESARE